jgi:hypothetical protein
MYVGFLADPEQLPLKYFLWKKQRVESLPVVILCVLEVQIIP